MLKPIIAILVALTAAAAALYVLFVAKIGPIWFSVTTTNGVHYGDLLAVPAVIVAFAATIAAYRAVRSS